MNLDISTVKFKTEIRIKSLGFEQEKASHLTSVNIFLVKERQDSHTPLQQIKKETQLQNIHVNLIQVFQILLRPLKVRERLEQDKNVIGVIKCQVFLKSIQLQSVHKNAPLMDD